MQISDLQFSKISNADCDLFLLFIAFSKFLVFATRQDLRVVSLDVQNKVDSILPVEVYKNMKAVDYDPVDQMIYWTDDLSYGVILRTFVNGSGLIFLYHFNTMLQKINQS